MVFRAEIIPGLLRNGQGADCGLDRFGKPGDLRRSGHSKAHVPSESQNTTFFRRFVREKRFVECWIWTYKGTACFVNQAVSSSSLREPSARWRKVKYFPLWSETTFMPFTSQKALGNDQSGALVAVDEGVISSDAESVRGSETRKDNRSRRRQRHCAAWPARNREVFRRE